MKVRLLIVSLCAMFVLPAVAADVPKTSGKAPKGMMGVIRNLTQEQQDCITKNGCDLKEFYKKPKVEKKSDGETKKQVVKEGQKKMDMGCIRDAMKKCGIALPTLPDTPEGINPNKKNK